MLYKMHMELHWANTFLDEVMTENFQRITFFWIIENYGNPLLHLPWLHVMFAKGHVEL